MKTSESNLQSRMSSRPSQSSGLNSPTTAVTVTVGLSHRVNIYAISNKI